MVSFLWVEGELLVEKKQGFLQLFNIIINELEMEKKMWKEKICKYVKMFIQNSKIQRWVQTIGG